MQKAAVLCTDRSTGRSKKAVCGLRRAQGCAVRRFKRHRLAGSVFRRYDVCMGAASKGIYLIRKVLHGFTGKYRVLCTPGSAFGSEGEGHVRFALVLPPEEIKKGCRSSRSVVMKDTVYFIVISLIMVVMAYFVAFGCEKLIEKKTHVKFSSEKTKVNKLVIMAMLSAVAVVLMYFDFRWYF